jgi:2-C-methyl-D-erythritol 4-phosphate cytidylyltransferase
MTEASFWAVIPAAGIGRRMGTEIPKQYLSVNGRRIIDWSIDAMLSHPLIDGLSVALAVDDPWWSESEYAEHPDVVRVDGGRERSDSVLSALLELGRRVSPDDWVLVHDAARPCLRRDDITRLIEVAREHPVGGLLGMPVRDTMKRSDARGEIRETVSREHLWHAFTPQMFRLRPLTEALQAARSTARDITDEASAMEAEGLAPRLVEGRGDNLKITRPDDLALAEFYLSAVVD